MSPIRTSTLLSALLLASSAFAVEVTHTQSDPAVKFAVKDLERILAPVEGRIVLENDAALPTQQWRLKTREDGALVIYGRDGVALAYGIYAFLEEHAGVRWYAYDTEYIPDLSGWKIPRLDVSRRPAILDREMYVASDYMDVYWRLRNKETMRAAFSAGVSVGSPRQCHTFAVYAKAVTNDALKAIGISGKVNGSELCMTKKEVRRIVAQQMIRYIKADRKAKVPAGREYLYPSIYELSQNDGGSAGCRCEDCAKFCRREGSWAGPNLDFVNGVAEIVGREFPEITVRTFAYSYTELPPKTIRARDNVQVRFCRSFLFAPLVKGSYNGDLLEAWDEFAGHKSVWAYWRQYSGGLTPMVKSRRDIAAEMRFCQKRGVTGYFAEAEQPLSRSFGLMQDWLFLKLADNPSLDIDGLSAEFMNAYYGKAAPVMDRYLTYLENRLDSVYRRLDHDYINRMNSGDMAQYVVIDDFPDREFFERADRWFDEAETLLLSAGDQRSLRHIREERAVTDRAVFDFWPRLEKQGYRADLRAKAERYGSVKRTQTETFFRRGLGKTVDEERAARGRSISCETEFLKRFPLPTPDIFADAEDVITINWNNSGDSRRPVKDPAAPGGYAGEIPAAPKTDAVVFGYYQSVLKKMGDEVSIPFGTASGPGYRLFRIARNMEMISPHYVYLNGWHHRVWIPSVGLPPDKRDVWINARVTEDGALRFDRIFLVKNRTSR